ncbi:tRNA pseudouridine(38-40) synthase [Cryptococcus sp. DSM 104549]
MSTPDATAKRARSPTPTATTDAPAPKRAHVEQESASASTSTAPAAATAEVEIDPEEAMFNQTVSGGRGGATPRGKGKKSGRKYEGKIKPEEMKDGRRQRAWEPREKKEGEPTEARLPKRRVAVLIGYCGTGYQGMQIQEHTTNTIEGEIFAALVKAGAVSADNAIDARKVDIARAARTDAGVHAAGNAISIKLITEPPIPEGFSSLAEYVTSMLPPQIRMWGFVRTVKSFNARTAADSRIYEYLLPSYCLLPPSKEVVLAKYLDESCPDWREVIGPACEFSDATNPPPIDLEGEPTPQQRGEFERRRGWRVDERTMKRFRDIIAQYTGTHNFHNYTVGKPFADRAVKRFMMNLEVKDPQVYGDIEWISVQIHGQSFMLHQIRKMISMAMLACRTGTPPSLLPETFGPTKIHIPKAPPLGLLLEAPQFGVYNERITKKMNGITEDRDPVDFGLYKEEIHAFKVKWIYERLRQEELQHHVFHKWMKMMDYSKGNALKFLGTKGVIPPEAVGLPPRDTNRRANMGPRPIAGATSGSSGEATTGAEGKDGEGERDPLQEELESEDEEIDQEALRKGELEG